MRTWREIITETFEELGVIGAGESVETTLLENGIKRLKLMLESWELDSLIAPGDASVSHTVPDGGARQVFTLGPVGADIITAFNYFFIRTITYRLAGGGEPYTLLETSGYIMADKQSALGGYPQYYYHENAHPLSRIHLDRLTNAGDIIHITARNILSDGSFELDDVIDMPRGFKRAIMLNLAVELASKHGISGAQLSPITLRNATRSLAKIKRVNHEPNAIRYDPGLLWHRSQGSMLGRGRQTYR